MKRKTTTIFILYFAFAIGYSILMPIWEAPDESAHYHLAWSFARRGAFPEPGRNYESHQPRPYYYLAAGVIYLMDQYKPEFSDYFRPEVFKYNLRVREPRYGWNAENYRFLLGVYALRWVNVLFGAGALWLIWLAYLQIIPENEGLQSAALALAAFTPQFLHIMAAISNDVFGVLAGAALFYLATRFWDSESTAATGALVVFSFLFPLTTKLTVLPVGAAVLAALFVRTVVRSSRRKFTLALSATAVFIIIVILGALKVAPDGMALAWNEIVWRLTSFRDDAFTWKYLWTITWQLIRSYWGWVGWLAVELPPWISVVLTTLGAAGLLLSTRMIASSRQIFSSALMKLTWLIAVVTLAAVFRNGLTTIASQGRFLFPAIGPLSRLMVSGWHAILPGRFKDILPGFVIVIMLGSNIILWLTGVLPVYYQPMID